MNDEFLHRLRKPPPPRFAAALKGRLDALNLVQQGWGWLRTLLLMFVAGGAAVATTLVVLRGAPTVVTQMFDSSPGNSPTLGAPGEAVSNSSERVRRMVPFSRAPVSAGQAPGEIDVHDRLLTMTTPGGVLEPGASPNPSSAGQQIPVSMLPTFSAPLFIVGSSTTYRLAQLVASDVEQVTGQAARVARDDSDVIRAFCGGETSPQGAGPRMDRPQMAVASARMSSAQGQQCSSNGVEHVIEVRIGRQAVVLSGARGTSAPQPSRHELYLALARVVPDPQAPGKLIDNPYRSWNQINPALGNNPIQIFGPSASAALREPVDELVMEAGCNGYPWIKALKDTDENRYELICHGMRLDGAYVEMREDDRFLESGLLSSPGSLALVSYPFYDFRRSRLTASELEGVAPSTESVESGEYPATRTLYIYVNREASIRAHNFWSFMIYLLGESGIGRKGPLVRSAGMILLSEKERLALEAGGYQLQDRRF